MATRFGGSNMDTLTNTARQHRSGLVEIPGMLGKTLLCITLAGCAPMSLRPTAEHISHVTDHRHGENLLSLSLVWHGPFTVEVGEGYSVHGIDGCLDCPREQFHARVFWDIPLTRGH